MKYAHVLSYVAHTPWAIDRGKMQEILAFLAFKAAGGSFSPEQIRARLGDTREPAPVATTGAVAVVPLRGVIVHRADSLEEFSGGMSAERFTRIMRQVAADESVGTIVINVDSPGGSVIGVPEAAQAVREAREQKRIVAIANSTMASAAYWIASQAHEIVALPSIYEGRIGSIGVFAVHTDVSAALEAEGIKLTVVSSRPGKVDGLFGPLSEEALIRIRDGVMAADAQFLRDVARGRGVAVGDVREQFGQGAALNAKDALAAGMIDRIETFEELLARLTRTRGRAQVGARAEGALAELGASGEDLRITLDKPPAAAATAEPEPEPAAMAGQVQADVDLLASTLALLECDGGDGDR